MYVETYEKSSKWTLFSNMRFIAVFVTAVCFLFLIEVSFWEEFLPVSSNLFPQNS